MLSACDEVALQAKSVPAADEDERKPGKQRATRGEAGAFELHLREELREEVSVVHDHAACSCAGGKLVREAPGNRHRRLGIVRVVEIGEDAPRLGLAQPFLERMQEHRVLDLLTPVRAEARRDESCRGNYVVSCERRRRNTLGAVPGGDSGRVSVHDREEPRPGLPLCAKRVELVGEKSLGLGAGDERATGEGKGECVESGHVERGSACRAPDQLEQKSTVGCGDPAGAEGDVDLGLPDHMGDAEAGSHDRHTRTRSLPLARLVGREPERSGLEEQPQVSR
ncbi:MAG: hypothetical protein M3546_15370 [Actinomycetota bacterium]|nr:hypothetical protein [Actinomycetota bacterium]